MCRRGEGAARRRAHLHRIAPCLSGATLTSRDGDAFIGTGTGTDKVGPSNLTDGGYATFVSVGDATGVVVRRLRR